MSWWKKVINFFKPLPADELLNPLKDVKKEEPVVEEVLEEIKSIHSGYFKKNNFFYDQYYENHIETVNKWLDLSKINKKKIISLTPSNIF